MKPEEDIRELPKDTLVIGTFLFHDTPTEDANAEIIVIKEKQVGLKFGVSRDIEQLMRKAPCDMTPTDRSRRDAHIERCVEEEYVISLIRLIEHDFKQEEDLIQIFDVWQQGYAYRTRGGRHYRTVMLECPKDREEDGERVVAGMLRYFRDQTRRGEGIPEFEAFPGPQPGSYRRRK